MFRIARCWVEGSHNAPDHEARLSPDEGDWRCPMCNNRNFASKVARNRCGAPRPKCGVCMKHKTTWTTFVKFLNTYLHLAFLKTTGESITSGSQKEKIVNLLADEGPNVS